jgi:hypothetical protein
MQGIEYYSRLRARPAASRRWCCMGNHVPQAIAAQIKKGRCKCIGLFTE